MKLPRLLSVAAVAVAAVMAAAPLGAYAQDLQMWERTGGNATMVDKLVEMWNAKNPDRKIVLTYIEHSEMVPKLAQAIASGEVPDLMGLDLIYGPQFEAAGQLEDITDYFKDDPTLKTASPGHILVSTYQDRLYGVPLYADVSVIYWNKLLFKKAGLDPEVGPQSLQDIHAMAAKITALGDGNYGYYLPGNCAGCNIFTFGPLIWASGGKIEPLDANDEPLVGDNIKAVLEWARMMHKEGLINPAAQSENGSTFAEQLGSGKIGIMGTGNFNLSLLQGQNPELFDNVGVGFLPGIEKGSAASFAGGDIVTVPKGSKRVADAVDFMKFILSDEVQVEGYAKLLNLTTRGDMANNQYFTDPRVVKMASALDVARTPYTLKFFELINSPQGPWLQMLQRVYYTDDPIDQVIADAKAQMKAIAAE